MSQPYITLREAVESGRLEEFADQEEARGVGPAERADLERVIRAVARVLVSRANAINQIADALAMKRDDLKPYATHLLKHESPLWNHLKTKAAKAGPIR